MERVWFLQKDAQESIQEQDVGSTALEQRVTELNLTMFEFCLDALKVAPGGEEAVETVADACVARFDNDVRAVAIDKPQRTPTKPGVIFICHLRVWGGRAASR